MKLRVKLSDEGFEERMDLISIFLCAIAIPNILGFVVKIVRGFAGGKSKF